MQLDVYIMNLYTVNVLCIRMRVSIIGIHIIMYIFLTMGVYMTYVYTYGYIHIKIWAACLYKLLEFCFMSCKRKLSYLTLQLLRNAIVIQLTSRNRCSTDYQTSQCR